MKRLMVAVAGVLAAAPLLAEPTKVTVRAISRDAKVIGTLVGGARITIRDVRSGRVLAEGVQLGGTGDTKTIMLEPHARKADIYGAGGAASFVATLDIDAPTPVVIEAEGPLGFPQATRRASKEILLLPGKNIEGEGVLLEIHGFVIDIQEATPERVLMRMVMT